eukprot:gnl/MRDRNA2_/MRDRNA2_99256_c0_seq1.p1 gnl/MRDRNA2_/MRDRNA2_99256_c0~~gnl/MRDRNA2_/MRDRNA2_99256_c0_seq1.p1  ORF type:complete len:304 (+),score=79.39 gnl/MRDRNA2_/MRDRNA2_99256_c0_seq1:68-979(+)
MGYYGLGPGLRTSEKFSDFERVLRCLPLNEALAILSLLEALTRSIVSQPKEQKHRQLKSEDKKFDLIIRCPEALDVMREMGWLVDQDPIVLPTDVRLDFQKHVGKIIDAKDFYVKEHAKAKKAARLSADPAKAEALRQIEIDRQERAALEGQKKNEALNVFPSTEVAPALEAPAVHTQSHMSSAQAIEHQEQKLPAGEEVTGPKSCAEATPATYDVDLKALAQERKASNAASSKGNHHVPQQRSAVEEVTVQKTSVEPMPANYDVDLKSLAKERMDREKGKPKPPPQRQEKRESYCSNDCTIC